MKPTWGDGTRNSSGNMGNVLNQLRAQQLELETQNSALRQAQTALMNSEKRYTDLFDFAPVGYATLNEEGVIIEANVTLAEMLCGERGQFINRSFTDFISEGSRGLYYQHRSALLLTKEKQHFELQLKQADGGIFDAVLDNVISPKIDGNGGQSRIVVSDISRRRALEREKVELEAQIRQSQKMQALGTLAGGIAHEFNNILAVIFGSVDVARFEIAKERPIDMHLEQILHASRRAQKLVQQILMFSRKNERAVAPVNLTMAVRKFEPFLTSSVPVSVRVQWDLCSEACPVVVDPSEIHQVLMNLTMNSVFAMKECGSLTIRVGKKFLDREDIEKLKASGWYALLEVTDDGCGMDSVTKERIFEPFFTTKPVGEGTGMGLSLVYSIVERASGTIVVESVAGKGTTFIVYFPITENSAKAAPLTDISTRIRGKERILLVEDDEMLAATTQSMLEHLGYQVMLKRDGMAAKDAFTADCNAFDLLITDQVMPRLTGVELAKCVLALRPELPIILCTGYSSQIDEAMAKAIGIASFAVKPLSAQETGTLIRRLLDK